MRGPQRKNRTNLQRNNCDEGAVRVFAAQMRTCFRRQRAVDGIAQRPVADPRRQGHAQMCGRIKRLARSSTLFQSREVGNVMAVQRPTRSKFIAIARLEVRWCISTNACVGGPPILPGHRIEVHTYPHHIRRSLGRTRAVYREEEQLIQKIMFPFLAPFSSPRYHTSQTAKATTRALHYAYPNGHGTEEWRRHGRGRGWRVGIRRDAQQCDGERRELKRDIRAQGHQQSRGRVRQVVSKAEEGAWGVRMCVCVCVRATHAYVLGIRPQRGIPPSNWRPWPNIMKSSKAVHVHTSLEDTNTVERERRCLYCIRRKRTCP